MRILFLKIGYWGTRGAFVFFILFLIGLAFFFNQPALHLGPVDLHNPFYFLRSDLDWWIYLLLYFSLVFALNTAVFLAFTLFFRFYKRRKQLRIRRYEHIYTDHIIEYLYNTDSPEAPADNIIYSIRNRARRKFQKLIILDILRRIHVQVKDGLRIKTAGMLSQLQLDKWAGMLIHSPYFGDKILAMKTIADFKLPGYERAILKLTASRNYVLRTEAFVSLIKLNVHNDLDFLSAHPHYVSFWDMNLLLKISRESEYQNVKFAELIQSDIPRVSALGVALAGENNRQEFKDLIRQKIGNPDATLNEEAFKTLLILTNDNADFAFALEHYPTANEKVKSIIINSLSRCNDKNITIPFLVQVIENEPLLLKTLAMKQLLSSDINRVQAYKTSENPDIIKAYKQVIDFHIK